MDSRVSAFGFGNCSVRQRGRYLEGKVYNHEKKRRERRKLRKRRGGWRREKEEKKSGERW